MICRTCLVSELHPGVELDATGQCNLCGAPRAAAAPPGAEALRELITPLRGPGSFDCLVCWSGGKDSTFVLDFLTRELGLRVAAFTFDNTFLAPTAFANMATVREHIPVEHVIVSPGAQTYRAAARAAFEHLPGLPADSLLRQGLQRHGPACYLCGTSFHHLAMRQALLLGCRMIVTGFTSGQSPGYYRDYRGCAAGSAAPRAHPSGHWRAIGRLMRRFFTEVGVDAAPLFLDDREGTAAESLSFVRLFDFVPYDPAAVLRRVQELGWQPPAETDSCSSNCLLNGLGIQWYRQRFGCHPYAPELSELVRRGVITRDEGQAILDRAPDAAQVRHTAELLGLEPLPGEAEPHTTE